jgi:hypothetical protein
VKEDLIDNIQSQEKKEMGRFCSMMQKITTDADKETIPYHYKILFEKYWKFSRTNKKLFKCILTK